MRVRRATIEDLPLLVEFTAREAQEAEGRVDDVDRLEAGVKAALEDESLAMYWVMIDERDQPAGSISALREWSDWNAGDYWWIQSVYIVPEHRGRGHLTHLLQAVQDEMESRDGLELRLYVHGANAKAIRAYEKVGFERSHYEIMVRTDSRRRPAD